MHDEMREPTEEELRAAMEEQMSQIRVEDVILQSVATLVNLAGRRLGLAGTESERDLEQAKLAIDAARALVPLAAEEQREPIRQALTQVQMAFAREAGQPAAASSPPRPSRVTPRRVRSRSRMPRPTRTPSAPGRAPSQPTSIHATDATPDNTSSPTAPPSAPPSTHGTRRPKRDVVRSEIAPASGFATTETAAPTPVTNPNTNSLLPGATASDCFAQQHLDGPQPGGEDPDVGQYDGRRPARPDPGDRLRERRRHKAAAPESSPASARSRRGTSGTRPSACAPGCRSRRAPGRSAACSPPPTRSCPAATRRSSRGRRRPSSMACVQRAQVAVEVGDPLRRSLDAGPSS